MSNSVNEDEIVFFEMPDGTKVSNDPRWQYQQGMDAREEALGAFPDRGRVGAPDNELAAQLNPGASTLQTGQEGDFEVDDLAVDGRTTDRAARKEAEDAGNTPNDPEVTREVPDSNEAVLKVRQEEQERQEAEAEAQRALSEAGDDEGEGEYASRTGKQLKAVLARKNAERAADGEEPLDTSGVKKKAQLAELLAADDERQS